MFDFGPGKKINDKFDIREFVVGNRASSHRPSLTTSKDEQELFSIIKSYDMPTNKALMEYEEIQMAIKKKRTEIRDRYKELMHDPENEASFHSIDNNLINSLLKITAEKNKLIMEKFKNIREEKKLYKASVPENLVINNNNSTEQNNSPLNRRSTGEIPNQFVKTNMIDMSSVVNTGSVYDVKPSEILDSPVQEAVVLENTISNDNKDDLVLVSNSITGEVVETVHSYQDTRTEEVRRRIENPENFYSKQTSVQDVKFDRSINTIKNKTKNLERVLYVDKNTGKFWIQEFELKDTGKILNDTVVYPSIVHLGELTFNSRQNTVKTQFDSNPIKYEIRENTSEMPSYYEEQWNEPEKKRFILDYEKLSLI